MERSEGFEKVNVVDANVSVSPSRPVSESPHHPVAPSTLGASTIRKWIVRISRFFLAALFLFTAGAKLAILSAFVHNMAQLLSSSGLNYEIWSWPFTIALIAIEIGIAVLLLLPKTVRLGALLAGLLLIVFAGYALYYVYVLNGEPLECGCFGGIIGSQLGVKTALRNLFLLIPAVVVWFGYKRSLVPNL